MVNSDNQNTKVRKFTNKRPKTRSWPVTILALLLAIQGIAMFILATYHITLVDLGMVLTLMDFLSEDPLVMRGIAYYGLGALGLFASLGFFRLWPLAWMLGIVQQGLTLTMALILYFQNKPVYIYPMMVYGILMVIYLNYSDVTNSFMTRPITEEWGGIDEE
jgi:hypothetical protein